MDQIKEYLRRVVTFWTHDIWSQQSKAEDSYVLRLLILIARTIFIVVTGFRRERIKLRAAALTYMSLLSLVPALAVAFSIFTAFVGLKEVEGLAKNFIIDALVPSHREQVMMYLDTYINQTHAGKLGGVGTAILFFTVISLLANIEKSFNDIWGLNKDRTILQRFQVYWPLVTLGPILLGLSLSLTAAVEASEAVQTFEAISGYGLLAKLGPIFMTCGFLTFLYLIMPNTRVPFKCALIGGLVAGLLWVGAQKLFSIYAAKAITYSAIYGSLGAVPLFILWIYVSWIVALLGASLTFAIQSARTYEPESELNRRVSQRDREHLAARLLVEVSSSFAAGKGALAAQQLIDDMPVSPRLVHRVLGELVESGLLVETAGSASKDWGFAPGHPLDKISVADVVRVMRSGKTHDLGEEEDSLSRCVNNSLIEAEEVVKDTLGRRSLADVVTESSQQSEPASEPTESESEVEASAEN